MATEIADWSANDLENVRLDEINLSREQGEEVAKLMGAIKRKFNAVDAAISGGGGGEWRWSSTPVYSKTYDGTEDIEDGLTIPIGDVLTHAAMYIVDSSVVSHPGTSAVEVLVNIKNGSQTQSWEADGLLRGAKDSSNRVRAWCILKPENGIYVMTVLGPDFGSYKQPVQDGLGGFVFAGDDVFVGDCTFYCGSVVSAGTVARLFIPEAD